MNKARKSKETTADYSAVVSFLSWKEEMARICLCPIYEKNGGASHFLRTMGLGTGQPALKK